MRTRTLATALVVASLGLVAAGCGDDNDDNAAATTQTQTQTQAAAEPENIVAAAQATPDLSTLVKAVTAADLASTLQEPGPYTVFAPTNAAFAEVQDTVDTLLEPANKEELQKVLTYHVVPGTYTAADLKDGQKLKTVEGQDLTVTVDGSTVKVNDATVAQADVQTGNGVVHVIDGVLIPPAGN